MNKTYALNNWGRLGLDGVHITKIAGQDWLTLVKRSQNTHDTSTDDVAFTPAYAWA